MQLYAARMHANSLDSRQKPFDDTLLVRLLRSITVLLDEQLQRARLEVTVLGKEGDTTPCLICLHVHNLTCTCKGYRRVGICAHVVAITALFIPGEYDREYLKTLADKLTTTKRKAHRPKNVVAGNRIQPHGDSEEDEEEEGEGGSDDEEEEEDSREEDYFSEGDD